MALDPSTRKGNFFTPYTEQKEEKSDAQKGMEYHASATHGGHYTPHEDCRECCADADNGGGK